MMNEFTREELQFLFSSVLDVVNTAHFPGLAGKIQSMIDNYCDHDPRNTIGQIGMYHCP
jgi:hypothetical protein